MRALLDVNVLLAIVDPGHVHHTRARDWWSGHQGAGWASCPLTQYGFVRVISQPSYFSPRHVAQALALLGTAIGQGDHEFWPDDISLVDAEWFEAELIVGPKQITDIYLLALAVKHGGRLVTFDRGIPLAAVRGARADHLVSL